jgi:hypothetical protein
MGVPRMIGMFPADESEPPYEDLIKQRIAVRLRIANCATARARLEYRHSLLQQRGRDVDLAAQRQDFRTRVDALNQLELLLREREARLTRCIQAREP